MTDNQVYASNDEDFSFQEEEYDYEGDELEYDSNVYEDTRMNEDTELTQYDNYEQVYYGE